MEDRKFPKPARDRVVCERAACERVVCEKVVCERDVRDRVVYDKVASRGKVSTASQDPKRRG